MHGDYCVILISSGYRKHFRLHVWSERVLETNGKVIEMLDVVASTRIMPGGKVYLVTHDDTYAPLDAGRTFACLTACSGRWRGRLRT
jgi:hypothetical protein